MMNKLYLLALFCALVKLSRSSEVNMSAQKNQNNLENSEMLNKKFLPNVKQLLKNNNDGDRHKFLRVLDGINIIDYEVVDGKK